MTAELQVKCECGQIIKVELVIPVDHRHEVRQHLICEACQNETNIERALNRYTYAQ